MRSAPFLLLSACLGLAAWVAPVSAESPVPELLPIVLQTDWYAEPEHGGFYEALAKGYYREAGLDVEIREGGPNALPAQMVATGRADFAIASSSDVIIAAGRGIPFVMLGAYMQRDPQGIMVHHGSGIRGFKDLDGKSVMTVPGAPFVAVLQKIYNIHFSVTPLDFGMSRFLTRPDFIQQCFVTNEPYYVRQQGVIPDVLLISDCGFSPYRVWFTRRRFLRDHPDAVRAFGAATIRGWREYIDGDPAPANGRIAALNPKMDAGFMAYSLGAMRSYKLVNGDPARGESLGRISRERTAALIAQLDGVGLLDQPVTVDEVVDGMAQ